jgi:uncharacterized membrane protein
MANRTSSLRALGIGFVAGLRSFTAPAAVSWAASKGRLSLRAFPVDLLDSQHTSKTATKLALGEIISDKTSLLPSRLKPPALLWRLASGAVCGAAIFDSDDGHLGTGAILGAAGALIGSLLGFGWRTRVRQQVDLPDLPSALLEDALAIGLAVALVSCPMRPGAHDAWADVDNPAWLP